jgi:hypothetical protein
LISHSGRGAHRGVLKLLNAKAQRRQERKGLFFILELAREFRRDSSRLPHLFPVKFAEACREQVEGDSESFTGNAQAAIA